MIENIKFKDDYVCFLKNQTFKFGSITLLVGDQGCGKSTLLSILKSASNNEILKTLSENNKQTKVLKLDLEKDNPRIQPGNPNDSKDFLYSLTSKFQSHGEVLLPILKLISEAEDTLILLDEPETSLSLRSQYLMIEIFKEALKRNNQIFLATHNLVFMEAFPDSVLSLEHKKYIKPKKFVELQKLPSNFKELRQDKIIKKTKCKLGIECTCANKTGWYNNRCENYINERGINGRAYSK